MVVLSGGSRSAGSLPQAKASTQLAYLLIMWRYEELAFAGDRLDYCLLCGSDMQASMWCLVESLKASTS